MKGFFAAASAGAYKLTAIVHLVISWWIIISVLMSHHDAQWQLIWIFLLPFSLLVPFAGYIFPEWDFRKLPSPWNDFDSFIVPTIVYGIIGPLQYFLLPVLVDGFMTRRARIVMIGDTYEHLDIDPGFVSWVKSDKVLRPDFVVVEWLDANPFAHNDPRYAPVGNFHFTPLDDCVERNV
jgi:hypothetical protein